MLEAHNPFAYIEKPNIVVAKNRNEPERWK